MAASAQPAATSAAAAAPRPAVAPTLPEGWSAFEDEKGEEEEEKKQKAQICERSRKLLAPKAAPAWPKKIEVPSDVLRASEASDEAATKVSKSQSLKAPKSQSLKVPTFQASNIPRFHGFKIPRV